MYSNKRQEESVAVWEFFLKRVQEMLAQAKAPKLKKELRYSARALRSLIRERAVLPGMTQSDSHKTERATQC
jgi:hypothetical protein